MSKQESVEDKWVQSRILRSQYEEVSKIVEQSSGFSNEGDFIRDAIREKINRWYNHET